MSVFAGKSASVAVFVTVRSINSATLRLVWTGKTGREFTSVTATVKVLVAFNGGEPLSVATVMKMLVPGPCASAGVHVITPLVSICAPGGGFANEYVQAALVRAVFVTTSVVSSGIVRPPWVGSNTTVVVQQTRPVIETVSTRQPTLPLPLSVPETH